MVYVALLRGINVGGRTIRMADLRECLETAGLRDVTTYLQSGNVVFSSDKKETSLKGFLEDLLRETFDYPARVQVYTLDHLRRVVEDSPFARDEPGLHSYVIFFERGLERELVAEATDLDPEVERVATGDGVLYWRVPKGTTVKSALGAYLTKARYRDAHTNRNINTLRKIVG